MLRMETVSKLLSSVSMLVRVDVAYNFMLNESFDLQAGHAILCRKKMLSPIIVSEQNFSVWTRQLA